MAAAPDPPLDKGFDMLNSNDLRRAKIEARVVAIGPRGPREDVRRKGKGVCVH